MQEKDIYSQLSSIKEMMERSTRFFSLSGLSGVLAGVYALVGAFIGYKLIYNGDATTLFDGAAGNRAYVSLDELILVAAAVLILSVLTGVWLTIRQAGKKGERVWNPVSKRMITSMAVPLVTGGLFSSILIIHQHYGLIAGCFLLFYGLALVAGGRYTFSDVKWLGYCEIFLGLLAAMFPGHGLIFWTIGFGLLHILYGSVMHFKYNN